MLLAAATTAPRLGPRKARAVAFGLLVLFLARIGVVAVAWERAGTVYERMLAALDRLPAGGRLAIAHPADAINSAAIPKTHLPVLAIARRENFVPTLFAFEGQQPVRLTEAGRRLAEAASPPELWAALIAGTVPPGLREFDAVAVLSRHPFKLPPNALLQPLAVEPDFAVYTLRR
jgi:hypothetical protein